MIEVNENINLIETVGQPVRHYVSESGVYLGATDNEPLSSFEVLIPPVYSDQIWLFPEWGQSPSLLRRIEIAWQTDEMAFIANQLLAIEEEAEDALPGTRSQWLSYRTKVRLWQESVNFPDSTKRPTRPT